MADLPVTLTVSAPDREPITVRCDSVRLIVSDSRDGRTVGGSVGIRRGHIPALMALAPGKVRAYRDGREIFSCETSGGLASVGGDRIAIMTDRFDGPEQPERP